MPMIDSATEIHCDGPAPVGPRGHRSGFRSGAILSAVCLLAVAADLLFFTGYYASDDKEYFFGAARVAETGRLSEAPLIGHTRLVVLAWNLVVGWLTHFDVQWMSASYVLIHVALILLTYRLAKRICGDRAALIAAYTSAVFPLYLLFSTGIYPDLFIACAFVLAVLTFLRWYECRREARNGRAAIWLFASGVWIGVSYMAKETGLLALPFFLFAWLSSEIRLWKIGPLSSRMVDKSAIPKTSDTIDPRFTGPADAHPAHANKLRKILQAIWIGSFFALGFLSIFLFEYKALASLTNNPNFFRLGWTEKEEDLDSIGNFHLDGGYRPDQRFLASLNRLSLEYWPPLLKICFAAGLLIYPFSPRRNWVAFFFGIWIYAFLTWGTYSFSHYYPPRIQARYYIPAFPFLIVVFSASLAWLLERVVYVSQMTLWRRRFGVLVAAGIVLSPMLYMRGPNALAGRLYRADIVANTRRAVSDALEAGPAIVVVGDQLETRIAPIWTDFPPLRPTGRRPDHVLAAREWRRAGTFDEKSARQFSYIHLPSVYSEIGNTLEYDRVGDLFHAASAEQFLVRALLANSASGSASSEDFDYYASVEPGRFATFNRGGFEFSMTNDRVYRHMFASRTRQLRAMMSGLKEIPVADKVEGSAVQRLRVSVSRVDWQIQSLRTLFGEFDWPALGIPTNYRIETGTIDWKQSTHSKGSFRISADDTAKSELQIELPANHGFTLHLAAKLERRDACRVQLKFHADRNRNSKVIREVDFVIRNGMSSVSFQTFETSRFLAMSVESPNREAADGLKIGLARFVRNQLPDSATATSSTSAD